MDIGGVNFCIMIKMFEYYTEAIVLDKEDLGDCDSRVFLYTKEFGRIAAKAKSLRKITSKLAGHLEPLNIVQVRLLANDQAVDALKIGQLPRTLKSVAVINLIKEISADGQADPELWKLLQGGKFTGHQVLSILGFNPALALCQICSVQSPENFLYKTLDFLCSHCLGRMSVNQGFFAIK